VGHLSESEIRLFRPHRGNFDAWRKYAIYEEGVKIGTIADGEVVSLDPPPHEIRVSVNGFQSERLTIGEKNPEQPSRILLCELAPNPREDTDPLRLSWTSCDTVQQRVVRFDRPPYSSGRFPEIYLAIGATSAFGLIGLAFLFGVCVKLWQAIGAPDVASILFLCTVGTATCTAFLFMCASGARSLYYYFKLPSTWRH
jgi:hypothetical protein